MISYLERRDIDVTKYDNCISKAINSKIYAHSWYLDIVADDWNVLIFNDYEAVMPIPRGKKYFFNYVYTPLWVLELGVFYSNSDFDYHEFFKKIDTLFSYIDLRLNSGNINKTNKYSTELRQFQYLNLKRDYKQLYTDFRKDRKKDLQKAKENNLVEVWNDDIVNMIQLFKKNVGTRLSYVSTKDYDILFKLIKFCLKKEMGEVLSVYQNKDLVASGFFLKYKDTITILISSTDFSNRNNGANTFFIDVALRKYIDEYSEFNFGGSSIKSIAHYFNSFGALTKKYYSLKRNNLPGIIKVFKQ